MTIKPDLSSDSSNKEAEKKHCDSFNIFLALIPLLHPVTIFGIAFN